ncbi:MAG: L-serine ammonia-lyase, iron-sulfur-dependent, subunit alpha [Lachnospiraceae bacterium]|nr:L-serine ammonia-lyase, iron-sulfur-dependent, subunit alpha [Lachnospiraceae bacterium]
MIRTDEKYITYVQILKEELVPAMGCTEPIAIAYAAAKAKDVLGNFPDRMEIGVSDNIIKNVKSVIVPNTDGLKGIEAAAVAGIAGGRSEKLLEVIAEVTPEQKKEMKEILGSMPIQVSPVDNGMIFDIIITLFHENDSAKVRICQYHTNIVSIEKNGEILYNAEMQGQVQEAAVCEDRQNVKVSSCEDGQKEKNICEEVQKEIGLADKSLLNIRDIIDFADTCEIADVKPILDTQIHYNTLIAEEGILGDYGANIGSTLLKYYGHDVRNRAIAKAAAGSDARMSGCEMPVVINSGSGNQGITVSVPVIEYAKELSVPKEKLYRALVISNLIAVHEKTGIGRLSAYCGAVSAGCAAGCGIAYLQDGGYKEIAHTLVNSLAIVSGIICDGAKPSCAAKIASSVEAGILGYHMYMNKQQFRSGDGIVTNGVEATIQNVGRLGREGMRQTDKEIVRIMMDEQ